MSYLFLGELYKRKSIQVYFDWRSKRYETLLPISNYVFELFDKDKSGILSSFMSNFNPSSLNSLSLNYSKLANYNSSNNNHNNSNSTIYSSTQYVDLAKLFCVVSTLLRCFDVSEHCSSHQANQPASSSTSSLPNIYSYQYELNQQQQQSQRTTEHPPLKLPAKIEDFLYKRLNYVKKVLEDAANTEETVKLMKFLCWENLNLGLDKIFYKTINRVHIY